MNLIRLKLGTLAAACLLSCAVMAAGGGGTSGGVKAPITAITTPISNFVPPGSSGYGFNFVPLALTAGATEQINPGDVHLLSNTGTAPLSIGALTISGTHAGDFSIAPSTTCAAGVSLPTLNSATSNQCAISLAFTPTALGERTATLALTTNAGVLTMPIIGTATTPFPTASFGAIPTAIDLGCVPFDLPVSLVIPPIHSAGFPVNNGGGLPLTLASAFTGTNPGDFRLVGSGLRGGPVGCPGVFPVGAGCTLIIAFVPQGEGTRSATFALTSDDPAHPVIATILLTGFGSPPLPPPAPAPIMSLYNVTDRWENVAEPGWSLNIANHPTINAADQLVASWNLFDVDTTDMWLTLKNGSWTTRTSYTGNLFHRLGSPYNAPFAAAQGSEAIVGTATLDFSSATTATFTYTVSGVTASKTIGRAVF